MTARSDCPDDVGRVGDINVVVHDDDKLSSIGSVPRAGGDARGLFGVSGIALLDRDHGKWTGLAAINETPDAFDLGNSGFLQLLPEGGGAERDREITGRRFQWWRAEHNRII